MMPVRRPVPRTGNGGDGPLEIPLSCRGLGRQVDSIQAPRRPNAGVSVRSDGRWMTYYSAFIKFFPQDR